MRLKFITVFGISLFFLFVVIAQLNQAVQAEECPLSCPISEPITGPTDNPSETPTPTNTPTDTPTITPSEIPTPTESVTPTVTPTPTPTGAFAISGKVTYRFFWFFANNKKHTKPAADVAVTAVNIFTHKTLTTHTNSDGNYIITPHKPGLYEIRAHGGHADFFIPSVAFIFDKNAEGKDGVDFQGFVFRK